MTKTLSKISVEKSWYLYFFLTAAAIIVSYFFLDKPLVDFFYAHEDEPVYDLIDLVTALGEGSWYLAASLVLYFFWRKRKPLMARAALFVFSTTLLSGVVINILKVIFGRARPKLYYKDDIFGFFWFKLDVLYRSFPSGHSTTAIGVWLAFSLLFPRYRWQLIAIGIIIASSRVILTMHYFSDVIAGGYIGAMTTLILYPLFDPHHGEKV